MRSSSGGDREEEEEEEKRGGGVSKREVDIEVETNWEESHDNFDDMRLKEDVLRGTYACGFLNPSVIQQKAISAFKSGRDLIAQAQSGTGKTAAYCLGVLEVVDPRVRTTQAIIMEPTKDLADQTARVLNSLSMYIDGLHVQLCIGGSPLSKDVRELRTHGSTVIVGTPGRIYDLLEKGHIHADTIKVLCIDEADLMLSTGFKEQLMAIFRYITEDTQVTLFSATIPLDVLRITEEFMRDPARILVKRDELTLKWLKQFYVNVEKEDNKLDTLCDLYEGLSISQAVIFVNTISKADALTERMKKRSFAVSTIHSSMTWEERETVLRAFRSGSARVLIATDVLARGIDVDSVNLVINYDLPTNRENYIHRIGRSARFSRKGSAINFICTGESRYLRDIEVFYNTRIHELPRDLRMVLD